MLVVDVIGFILNRKLMIKSLDGLQRVDDKLYRENITLDYRKQKWLTTFIIVLVTVCEATLNYFNLFLFRDTLIRGTWYMAILTTTFLMVPLYLTTVSKVWYIILVYNVREKLDAMNGHLLNTQKCISDIRAQMNNGPLAKAHKTKDDFVDLAGYLHKEIGLVKRAVAPQVDRQPTDDIGAKKKVKVGIVQVFPVNNGKYDGWCGVFELAAFPCLYNFKTKCANSLHNCKIERRTPTNHSETALPKNLGYFCNRFKN